MGDGPAASTTVDATEPDTGAQSLLPLAPLEAYLERAGLGDGPVTATPFGGGHSNLTYLVQRGGLRVALRRPPRPPLPPSAHDVLREARVLRGLAGARVPVPRILATCDDDSVIGAPFYVMDYLDGVVLSVGTPASLAAPALHADIAQRAVEALAALHDVDFAARPELAGLGRPDGYLSRQLHRFEGLWERGQTREVPALDAVTRWLADHLPQSPAPALVHGDYRIGNLMFAPDVPVRLLGVLDWEMATVGDPLADLGYLTAHWAGRDTPPTVMSELQPVTREPGFPDGEALAERYAELTGRSIAALRWYEVLALWKAAIFLEQSYARYLAGNEHDPWFQEMGDGVPALAEEASRRAGIGA